MVSSAAQVVGGFLCLALLVLPFAIVIAWAQLAKKGRGDGE